MQLKVDRWLALIVTVAVVSIASASELRTWTDSSGQFTITAEVVAVDGDQVQLRTEDGKEIAVPVTRLSSADQAFLKGRDRDSSAQENVSASDALTLIANQFYGELRNTERDAARARMTMKAQSLMQGTQSPLTGLPAPETGTRAIRVGRPKVDGKLAEIPVQVRAGGNIHKRPTVREAID